MELVLIFSLAVIFILLYIIGRRQGRILRSRRKRVLNRCRDWLIEENPEDEEETSGLR